jgi:hypothetical protein
MIPPLPSQNRHRHRQLKPRPCPIVKIRSGHPVETARRWKKRDATPATTPAAPNSAAPTRADRIGVAHMSKASSLTNADPQLKRENGTSAVALHKAKAKQSNANKPSAYAMTFNLTGAS